MVRYFAAGFLCCFLFGSTAGASQAIQGGLFRPGVTVPKLLWKVDPEYSEEARQARLEGIVILSVIVKSDGSIGDMRVIRPLGRGLDEKAAEAVRIWVFQPGLRDGKRADISVAIEFNFRLPAPDASPQPKDHPSTER